MANGRPPRPYVASEELSWRAFSGWCAAHTSHPALGAPQLSVLFYLQQLRARRATVSRLRTTVRAIHERHVAAGLPSPTEARCIRQVLAAAEADVEPARRRKYWDANDT